jgi:hypothetical protein
MHHFMRIRGATQGFGTISGARTGNSGHFPRPLGLIPHPS